MSPRKNDFNTKQQFIVRLSHPWKKMIIQNTFSLSCFFPIGRKKGGKPLERIVLWPASCLAVCLAYRMPIFMSVYILYNILKHHKSSVFSSTPLFITAFGQYGVILIYSGNVHQPMLHWKYKTIMGLLFANFLKKSIWWTTMNQA